MKLYLKNTLVYDIDNNILLDKQRAPGILQKYPSNETFSNWLLTRYSSNTNAFAHTTLSRTDLNRETHIFNLSDCYWITDDNTISFETASPYLNNYKDYTIPTLYTNGYLTKRWISPTQLLKCGTNVEIEVECSHLTRLCHIPCAKVTHHSKNAIIIENFTFKEIMLEAAEVSSRLNPDNFNESDILNLFHLNGFHMILIDAIFGNGDRPMQEILVIFVIPIQENISPWHPYSTLTMLLMQKAQQTTYYLTQSILQNLTSNINKKQFVLAPL